MNEVYSRMAELMMEVTPGYVAAAAEKSKEQAAERGAVLKKRRGEGRDYGRDKASREEAGGTGGILGKLLTAQDRREAAKVKSQARTIPGRAAKLTTRAKKSAIKGRLGLR